MLQKQEYFVEQNLFWIKRAVLQEPTREKSTAFKSTQIFVGDPAWPEGTDILCRMQISYDLNIDVQVLYRKLPGFKQPFKIRIIQ